MRADSFEDARQTCYDKFAPAPASAAALAFAESTGKRSIPGVSIGKTRTKKGGAFRLAVFTSDYVMGEKIKAHVAGEATVYERDGIAVPRITSQFSQKHHTTTFDGVQVGPKGKGWVGTGSVIVPMAEDPSAYMQLTNRHVSGFDMQRGDIMVQGGVDDGWHVGHSESPFTVPVPFDAAGHALRSGRWFRANWCEALDDTIAGYDVMRDADLFARFVHTGQTWGSREWGECIATDIDDHYIGYTDGVGRLYNQCAFRSNNPDGRGHSTGGHSGSALKHHGSRLAKAHLNSGGRANGMDITYGSADLPGSIRVAGGIPELV